MEEIVIVSTDLVGLDAYPRVVECFQGREALWEESGLYLFGNLQFMSEAALGFQFRCLGPSLRFHGMGHFVEADQRKGIPIDVFEPGEYSAPDRRLLPEQQRRRRASPVHGLLFILHPSQLRNMAKANSAPSPLGVGGYDILGDKNRLRRLADQLVVIRVGIGCDQGEDRRSVGRSNAYPALPRLQAHIEGQAESKLIHIEFK